MRGILDPVMKRVFALVAALAVASAPVAMEICRITCESNGMQPSLPHAAEGNSAHHDMPADHSSCHEHGSALQMSPINGLCTHGTGATSSLIASARNSGAAVLLLAAVPSMHAIAPIPTCAVLPVRESPSSNALRTPFAVPLRV
jgi:hypothetical protein